MTRSSRKRLEEELHTLRTERRAKVSETLHLARDNRDPLDDGEYQAACIAHTLLKGRIAEMEALLETARVIDDSLENGMKVGVGSIITIKDLETGSELECTLLASLFASLLEDGISDESPVGQALIGKKEGDIVEIAIPARTVRYQIVGLRY